MSDILGGGGRVERRTGSAPFGLEAAMRRIEGGDLREADARLVVQRLRECRSKTARWCESAATLRITDAEQRALRDAADILEDLEDDDGNSLKPEADTLRGLRERHAKGGET